MPITVGGTYVAVEECLVTFFLGAAMNSQINKPRDGPERFRRNCEEAVRFSLKGTHKKCCGIRNCSDVMGDQLNSFSETKDFEETKRYRVCYALQSRLQSSYPINLIPDFELEGETLDMDVERNTSREGHKTKFMKDVISMARDFKYRKPYSKEH